MAAAATAAGDVAPPPSGTVWQRLAAGVGGVGGATEVTAETRAAGGGGGGGGGAGGWQWPASPHPQSWCTSPYYDSRLFKFDHRALAPDERPRQGCAQFAPRLILDRSWADSAWCPRLKL